jgi:hypothetical protein
MSSANVKEIEPAIRGLTPQEIEELYVWLVQNCPQPINASVQSDLPDGRLHSAIQRALEDERNGRVRPL